MQMKYWFIPAFALLAACGILKKDNHDSDTDASWDAVSYDTVEVTASKNSDWRGENEQFSGTFQGSVPKFWDLMHTELHVSFNFEKREMMGKAFLKLKHHFEWQDSLVLDAKTMQIDSVVKLPGYDQLQIKSWKYLNQSKLVVYLEPTALYSNTLPQHHELGIYVKYVARPYSSKTGGSAAITDDRGLYFINHDLSNPLKPRQIWTQGETESSSRWFPTLDAPNQKTTQKIFMTVPDSMLTISNGNLVNSAKNTDSTRIDVWEHMQPHAPYLLMMAVGNWSKISDTWRGNKVEYYLEKQFAPYAKLIFGNTPEMLEFFSNYTGVSYPWGHYRQVVVRDFVSGAMENTTAVIHMEELQHTPREHYDESYEDYVSHELFHHWFGDLVTAESWSNITLNESFATYGEYLWREHKYGRDKADEILQDFRNQYRYSYSADDKTLIRHHYKSREDVFDVVSYQKGALILHMLRNVIGNEKFKAGMKEYLTKYAYKSAEVANLRMAFEEVTGQDLNWFFNQWYDDKSQPLLKLVPSTDSGAFQLNIIQEQKHRNTYVLPIKITYSSNGKLFTENVKINQRNFVWKPQFTANPDWWIFDSDNQLLADVVLITQSTELLLQELKKMSLAYDASTTNGLKLRIFELATNSLEPVVRSDKNEELTAAYSVLCVKALNSKCPHTASGAIENAKAGLAVIPNQATVAEGILKDISNPVKSRVAAMDLLRTTESWTADKFIPFTNDTSINLSVNAIMLQTKEGDWYETALNALKSTNSVSIAYAWGTQYLRADTSAAAAQKVFTAITANPAAGSVAFDRLFSWYVNYQRTQASWGRVKFRNIEKVVPVLYTNLRNADKLLMAKVMNRILKKEREGAEDAYKKAIDAGKEPSVLLSDYLTALRALYKYAAGS